MSAGTQTPSAPLPEKLQRLLDTLALVPDRQDRIQLLIDIARRFSEVPAALATRPYPESRRVPGCESEAFLWALPQPDGTLQLHFAVENPQGISAKAFAVILEEGLSGVPPEQILAVPSDLPYRIFGRELSMGKSMGLTGMLGMAQSAAKKLLAGG